MTFESKSTKTIRFSIAGKEYVVPPGKTCSIPEVWKDIPARRGLPLVEVGARPEKPSKPKAAKQPKTDPPPKPE